MGRNVFDQVARDYERIHNRSLPPGVHSTDFIHQRAARASRWISERYSGREFCCLDFGCGNGRMLKSLLASSVLRPWVENGRLRLFGFDPSVQSIQEARALVGDEPIGLISDWKDLPETVRFDFVISCHVFHHIPPSERSTTARTLRHWMKPGARIVIWEHNPFNPFTRLLVRMCPFDDDAHLLTLATIQTVFRQKGFRALTHAYVNLFPPRWLRFAALAAFEQRLGDFPVGAQYWAMFERHE